MKIHFCHQEKISNSNVRTVETCLETMSLLKMHCILQFPFHVVFPKCYICQWINDINNKSQNASGRWSFKYTQYFRQLNKTRGHDEHNSKLSYKIIFSYYGNTSSFFPPLLFLFFFCKNHAGFESAGCFCWIAMFPLIVMQCTISLTPILTTSMDTCLPTPKWWL